MENPEGKNKPNMGLLTTYNQSMDIRESMQIALGKPYILNIFRDITQDRFNSKIIRKVVLRVEPYLEVETSEQAARRLIAAGHVLANAADLVGYMKDHPGEMEKWEWVLALNEESLWACFGSVFAVFAFVRQDNRSFGTCDFSFKLDSSAGLPHGVLVVGNL